MLISAFVEQLSPLRIYLFFDSDCMEMINGHRRKRRRNKTDRPLSISADWKSLVGGLSEVAIRGFAVFCGKGEGVNTIPAAVSTVLSSFKTEITNNERARTLVILSFALAIDKLRAKVSDDEKERKILHGRRFDRQANSLRRKVIRSIANFLNARHP